MLNYAEVLKMSNQQLSDKPHNQLPALCYQVNMLNLQEGTHILISQQRTAQLNL